jgi:hypothetical protein
MWTRWRRRPRVDTRAQDELIVQADEAFWKVYEANIDDDLGQVLDPYISLSTDVLWDTRAT